MNKKLLEELKEKLEKEKNSLQKELESFATEDNEPKGDWDTRYPNRENGSMEEEADEVQEYDNLLSLEHNLELKLRDVNLALEKISAEGGEGPKGYPTYGACEKCAKKIDEDRLRACPEARLCMKCNNNK